MTYFFYFFYFLLLKASLYLPTCDSSVICHVPFVWFLMIISISYVGVRFVEQLSGVVGKQQMTVEKALALGEKAYKCAYEDCGRLYTTLHHLKVT